MNAPARLGLYGAALAVVFAAAYVVSGALVPSWAVAAWSDQAHADDHGGGAGEGGGEMAVSLKGLSSSASGYVLSPVAAPATTGERGELSFRIDTLAGKPLTTFATSHDKELHLIVVRSDGTNYRHVHPRLDVSTGTWSIPWQWAQAGTYRAYADFATTGANAQAATLTRTIEVAGDYTPDVPEVSTVDTVDGFTAEVRGGIRAGASSALTISIARGGRPVTTLQPYLGAFGHLVALREGDLAYLHVHAEGAEPQPGQQAGPDIAFAAEAPTAGRYLLYLDFQVDGKVHTAHFVLDAGPAATDGGTHEGSGSSGTHGGH